MLTVNCCSYAVNFEVVMAVTPILMIVTRKFCFFYCIFMHSFLKSSFYFNGFFVIFPTDSFSVP